MPASPCANIWLPRSQQRFRRATLLPPLEELLPCLLPLRLRTAGDKATVLGKWLARLFTSCPSSRNDSGRSPHGLMRKRCELSLHASHLRIMAALAPQYGRHEIRVLDSQRFSTAPRMGRSAAPAIRRLPGPDCSRLWVRPEGVIPPARPDFLCLCSNSEIW
jgi:hypothetical protein